MYVPLEESKSGCAVTILVLRLEDFGNHHSNSPTALLGSTAIDRQSVAVKFLISKLCQVILVR